MMKFFAAANSSGGFVSWFDKIFAPESLDRVYLIKGGSGTGKSTFMKKIAQIANDRGYFSEYFYCSADPNSLDGIILHRDDTRGIAFIDSTEPHTRDPKFPGAVEEIINLGQFWNTGILRQRRDEISELVHEKSEVFSDVYEYLFASGEINRLLRADMARYLLPKKLNSAANRLLCQAMSASKIKKEFRESHEIIRAVSAVSTSGIAHFDTFEGLCKNLAVVIDVMGSSDYFFDELIKLAKHYGLTYYRAPKPLEPEFTEALYFPELSYSVVIGNKNVADDVKLINMERFIDRGAITKDDKLRRRMLNKCSGELLEAALFRLAEIKKLHNELELIYISAMDFDRVNDLINKLADEIL